MTSLQTQLEAWLLSVRSLSDIAQATWAWPLAETIHFIGLTLLVGTIAVWDLRLMGLMRHARAAAFHRLIPFGIAGFGLNVMTGLFFLVAYPDQYIYNAAFHIKMGCMLVAGLNVAAFYVFTWKRILTLAPGHPPPWAARVAGGLSLGLWMTIIVCGRMITFFRPGLCAPGEALGFLADCAIR